MLHTCGTLLDASTGKQLVLVIGGFNIAYSEDMVEILVLGEDHWSKGTPLSVYKGVIFGSCVTADKGKSLILMPGHTSKSLIKFRCSKHHCYDEHMDQELAEERTGAVAMLVPDSLTTC